MNSRQRFRVLYEDGDLVVVDKAPGVLTVPTARGERNTLVQMLRQHLGRGRRQPPWLEVVHRLDREVSGVLVFARSPAAAERLRADFAAHRPEREYVALVAGSLDSSGGTFASRMLTGRGLQRYSGAADGPGEDAVTHYAVSAHVGGASLVAVRLETGRRNQIRVHFAEAGHPILGEQRYRPEAAQHHLWRARRLALHARLLAFTHPVTGASLRFESPLPPEFEAFLRQAAARHTPATRPADRAPATPARPRHPAGSGRPKPPTDPAHQRRRRPPGAGRKRPR